VIPLDGTNSNNPGNCARGHYPGKESLLLIGSGAASYRGYALETLAVRHRIVLLDYAAPTWQLPHIADHAVADLRDQVAVRTAVQELAARHELRGVLSWDEFAMVNTAIVARSLGLPGPHPDAVASCRDKARTRTLLDVHRVPSAQWEPVADLTGAREAGDRIGYPLVLKPASAAGSAGVVRVNHHSELADAMAFTRRATAEQGPEGSGMLAESYLDGPEVSVEIVTFRGRHHVVAVTRKELGTQPYFEETGHLVVAVDPTSDAASRIATAALYAVGLTHGVSHVEIRRTSTGPCVVEVNPRLAGDLIPRLVALSTGVDLVGAAAELALGRMPDLTPSRAAVAGVRFLYPSTAGRVKSLSVDAGLRAETWCERAVIEQQPGALVAPPPAAGLDSRLAHVVVIGASTTQCRSRLDRAAAAVHEVIIPADLVAAGAA
jgi:biotin carboxylase